MIIIFSFLDEALDCAVALGNAKRAYTYSRNEAGEHVITTRD